MQEGKRAREQEARSKKQKQEGKRQDGMCHGVGSRDWQRAMGETDSDRNTCVSSKNKIAGWGEKRSMPGRSVAGKAPASEGGRYDWVAEGSCRFFR